MHDVASWQILAKLACGKFWEKLADFDQTRTWRFLVKVGGFWPNSHLASFEKSWPILTKLALGEFWKMLADLAKLAAGEFGPNPL